MYSCLLETVKLFHLHGLKTIVIVCDGASVNLGQLKQHMASLELTLLRKVIEILSFLNNYRLYNVVSPDQQDPYEVSPYMANPYANMSYTSGTVYMHACQFYYLLIIL